MLRKTTHDVVRPLILLTLCASLYTVANTAWALDPIIRPFQSVRGAGMGSVKITTGEYVENFFGNPARSTANKKWKVSLFDITAETTPDTIKNVKNLSAGGGDGASKLASATGKNLHGRLQTAFPAVYVPHLSEKWSFDIGLLQSTQFDVDVRRSYQLNPNFTADLGPAITVARKFMRDDSVSVGVTTHATYRFATKRNFTLVDFIQSGSLKAQDIAADGAHVDFDLGATHIVHWKPKGWVFQSGFAVNNILGGNYSSLPFKMKTVVNRPLAQPRTFGFGLSARQRELWKFTDFVGAIEFTDIGNNPSGSLFRLLHMGAETRFGILLPRLGINQGYWTAGLGFDLKFFQVDLATYGEEMTLNPGGWEDRRYAVRIAFEI